MAALPSDTILAEQLPRREWMIRKSGYFYRPGRCGYTSEAIAAGLYTEAEATAEARIEDTISAHHASEFASDVRRARSLIERFTFID